MFDVHIYPPKADKNRLAEVELHFNTDPFKGLKLVGITVWTNDKNELNVTWPSRPYHSRRANKQAHYPLLRTVGPNDFGAYEALENVILDAYEKWDEEQAVKMLHNSIQHLNRKEVST